MAFKSIKVFALLLSLFTTLVKSQDNRCYLLEGGSSETFTVNEKLEIGGSIGKLEIMGSVGERGNISLDLSSEEIMSFSEGTKDLVLMKKLDKEGIDGPSSASATVYCQRLGTIDPPVPIPVRIIVTDFNDNAPEFTGAPYSVNVSEVTVVGTVIYDSIRARDSDQQGPSSTVEYFIDPSQKYSHYLRIDSSLEGSVVLNSSLDFETIPFFTVTVGAKDQGKPPRSTLTSLSVRVIDADDQNPKFYHDKYDAVLPENPTPGTLLEISPDYVRAYDPDFGINASVSYSFTSDISEYNYFELDRRTGNIFVKQAVPDDFVTPVTLVIQATQDDNPDRYSLTTVTLVDDTGFHTNTLQFLQPVYEVTLPEGSSLVNHPIQTIQTNKPADRGVKFSITETQDYFQMSDKGEIILKKRLDFESQKWHVFHVLANYRGMNATAKVNVTVMNINDHDPVFNETQYSFSLTDMDSIPGAFVGKVEVSDGDGDKVSLSLTGPHSKAFYMHDDGILRIKKVDAINSSETQLIVVATDTGIPSRQSSVPITVLMPGKMSAIKSAGPNQSVLLMIIFGSVLGVLLFVIITLAIYIVKNKKYRRRLTAMMMSPNRVSKNKQGTFANATISRNIMPENRNGSVVGESPTSQLGVENPIFNMSDNNNKESTLDDNVRFANRFKPKPIKVQPVQPPRVPENRIINSPLRNGTVSPINTTKNNTISPVSSENEFKQNNVVLSGKMNDTNWTNGSIPRRVKKLSWEDEKSKMTELDPDVSAAPLNKNRPSGGNVRSNDLTIYF